MSTFEESIAIGAKEAGTRLDVFLAQKIGQASRTQVQEQILERVSVIPERTIKASMRLRAGDTIVVTRNERILPHTPGVDAVEALMMQNHIAVIAKPPGLLVHRNSYEVTHTVDAYLSKIFPAAEHTEAVHRLDRETSGALLCALTYDAVGYWRESFQHRKMQKTYLALVDDPEHIWKAGDYRTIHIPLGSARNSRVRLAMGHGELPAKTQVFCHGHTDGHAWLELKLHQGRQHQIRVHLSLSGSPIVGDKLYGTRGEEYFLRWNREPWKTVADDPLQTPFHCLHAWRLACRGDQPFEVYAPLPVHIKRQIALLGFEEPAAHFLD